MGLLRQQAPSYGADPHKTGVIGFSVGAYLAANMSNTEDRTYPFEDTADRQSPWPDFAIVAYTARMLDNSKSRNSLELKPWVTISPKAPPTLILHAINDPMDAIRQPLAYALALSDAGCARRRRALRQGRPCLRDATNRRSDYAGMAKTVLSGDLDETVAAIRMRLCGRDGSEIVAARQAMQGQLWC